MIALLASQEKNIMEDNFPIKLFIDKGRMGCAPHWHDEIEIIYIIEGNVKTGVNNDVYMLNSSDILIMGSGDIHYFLPVSSGSRLVIQFKLSIFDSFGAEENEKSSIRPVFDNSCRISSKWSQEVKGSIENEIKKLLKEYTQKNEGYKLAFKARLYDIIVLLLRSVPKENRSLNDDTRYKEKLKRLENLFDYVDNNFQNEISLNDAAKIAGFSPYYFARFFKKYTGMTFTQYLNNYKITKAEWFLLNGEISVTDAAFKSGFLSIKTFNRVFKGIKGYSPTQYRKNAAIYEK